MTAVIDMSDENKATIAISLIALAALLGISAFDLENSTDISGKVVIENGKTLLELDKSKLYISQINSTFLDMRASKHANQVFEYGTYDKVTVGTKNNTFLASEGLLSHQKSIVICPKQSAFKLKEGQLKGISADSNSIIGEPYFYSEETEQYIHDGYGYAIPFAQDCNSSSNFSCKKISFPIRKDIINYVNTTKKTKNYSYWELEIPNGTCQEFFVDVKLKNTSVTSKIGIEFLGNKIWNHSLLFGSWGLYDEYKINNTNDYTLTNYTVFLNISLDRAYTDVNDFRFSYFDDSSVEYEIGFWRDTTDWANGSQGGANASGTIAIKVPYLYSGNTTIRHYYNASGKSDKSDITTAFLIGDEFLGSNLNTSQWTVLTNGSGGYTYSVSGGTIYMHADGGLDSSRGLFIQSGDLGNSSLTTVARITQLTNTSVSTTRSAVTEIILAFGLYGDISSCSDVGGGICSKINNSLAFGKSNYSSAPAACKQLKRVYSISQHTSSPNFGDEYTLRNYFTDPETLTLTKNSTHGIASNYTGFNYSGAGHNMSSSHALSYSSYENNISFGVVDYSDAAGTNASLDLIYVYKWEEDAPTYIQSANGSVPITTGISYKNITPLSPYTTDNLLCNVTATDTTAPSLNISYEFYKNGANQTALAGSINVSNNTNTNVANASFSLTSSGENWSCRVRSYNGVNYSGWESTSNVSILNSPIVNASISGYTNATVGHWFYVNATADDADGGTDITSTNISIDYGSCAYYSNSTAGNSYNVSYNCSSSSAGNASSIIIGFTDSDGNYNETSAGNNSYPDLTNSTLSGVDITPTSPYITDILTCNTGTYSDTDGDEENSTARAWRWFRNNTLVAGETSQTLNTTGFYLGDNVSCEETASALNWPESIARLNSSNVTLSNYIPNITSVIIYPVKPYINDSIYCNVTVYDVNHEKLNISFEWYRNGTNQSSLAGTYVNITNYTDTTVSTLTAANTSIYDVWKCKVRAFDGTNYSEWENSANKTITPNPINTSLGSGISGMWFYPKHAFEKNVSAENQTESTALFYANHTNSVLINVTMKLNASIDGFTLKCGGTWNQSTIATITDADTTVLSQINDSYNHPIYCWADFDKPSRMSQDIEGNVSIEGA